MIPRAEGDSRYTRGALFTNGDLMAKNARTTDDAVYKMLELTGTSSKSIEDAVQIAISRADQTVRNLRWFEILETRGAIENGRISQWQVMLKAGFRLDA